LLNCSIDKLLIGIGLVTLKVIICIKKKWVSYLYRTATTTYPCYLPVLGEFSRSWSYKTYPSTKV